MRITQLYTSLDVECFGAMLAKTQRLHAYHDRYRPAVFFGCYRREDLAALAEHQSVAVLLWGGSDAMLPDTIERVAALPRTRLNPIYHVAQSSFIAEDLREAGVPFMRSNVVASDTKIFQPAPLGRKVYFYYSAPNPKRFQYYGGDHLPLLQEQLPGVEFVIANSLPATYEHARMPEVYRECAVGIRLVPHDGASCTVVEMALMGRKCIWNGEFPSAIPYRSLGDVVAAVKHELARSGEIDHDLAAKARAALGDDAWLYVENHQRLIMQESNERLVCEV